MKLTDEQIYALSEKITEKLKTVYDPEIPADIYEMGLIYDVQISDEGEVKIIMTLTTPNCPVADSLPMEVEQKAASVEGVSKASVDITFDPPWDKEMMSEEARFKLGIF